MYSQAQVNKAIENLLKKGLIRIAFTDKNGKSWYEAVPDEELTVQQKAEVAALPYLND